ncbi:hypothetical protein BPOR_0274g00080 [Botrytis porri]|uniref:Uncharacterized protein n=1 Tax=Botrytis porri TaxID=87229 RepID=A0A4Z1KL82_9HELO|nr:hypothetical protein BPOR_0274g00080 [Botrytis porri]
MGAKKPPKVPKVPGVPNSFFGPAGPAVPSPVPALSAEDQAAADQAAADLLAQRLIEEDMAKEEKAAADALAASKAAADLAAGKKPPAQPPFEAAPDIQDDPVALAARLAPARVRISDVGRWNLLPTLGAGLHPVSTSGAGLLCAMYAMTLSYSAARDLAAPVGTPVPLRDNPTAEELIEFVGTDEFWAEAVEYMKEADMVDFFNAATGEPLSSKEILRLTKLYISDEPRNYNITTLFPILRWLNRKYGTHYVIGSFVHGFNVRWDIKNKIWEVDYQDPTQDRDMGRGVNPYLWLWNDNAESETRSLHNGDEAISHWMGFSTLHRNLDQDLIDESEAWFGNEVDAYLEEGVWIVTADVEGYQADLEDHQDPRELRLFTGHFVREPTIAPIEDAPDGYMWVQGGPFWDGILNEGLVGIVPMNSIKRITKDVLRIAHDAAGATVANIIKNSSVKKTDKGLWQDFLVHRAIEPTTKIGAKYANPNNPAKKFVAGFAFEDGEFLVDTQEPLRYLRPRMIKLDGTRGRVKPRNLQYLERAWRLPEVLPIPASVTKKIPTTSAPPGKKNFLGTSNKSDPKYRYSPTMKAEDFKIADLRNHCKARGMVAKDYGRKKVTMLAKLIEHDEKNDNAVRPTGNQPAKPADSSHFLPMRRVMVDIAKDAGPPKMPPFFATEIVVELGKGDIVNPATWIIDYEGHVGRIDDDNLEPIERAWGIELDPIRWNLALDAMKKEVGYDKPPKPAGKPASKPLDPNANPAANPAVKTAAKPAAKPVAKPATKPAGKKVAFENPPSPGSAAPGVPAPNSPAGKTVGKRPASSSAEPANRKTKKKKKK